MHTRSRRPGVAEAVIAVAFMAHCGGRSSLIVPGDVVSSDAADSGPNCAPLPDGLVGWWPGNESTDDLSPFATPGAWIGAAAYTPAVVGAGFDETHGGWVQVPDHPSIELTSEMTLLAWVRTASWGGRVVDKITVGAGDGYLLDTHGGVARVIAGMGWVEARTPLPAPGSFVHLAGVFTGSTRTVTLYVDGASVPTLTPHEAVPGVLPVNSFPIRIGADSTGNSLFDGTINDVMVFRRALTAAEVEAIYRAGPHGFCSP